ncbi:hypothetical protein J6590_026258 [Homalodisca vitripennis]|nr:hypothetical protein J6590_026258 [Homalodisca vitripennis]
MVNHSRFQTSSPFPNRGSMAGLFPIIHFVRRQPVKLSRKQFHFQLTTELRDCLHQSFTTQIALCLRTLHQLNITLLWHHCSKNRNTTSGTVSVEANLHDCRSLPTLPYYPASLLPFHSSTLHTPELLQA